MKTFKQIQEESYKEIIEFVESNDLVNQEEINELRVLSPAQRRKLSIRMKLLARKASTKIKRKLGMKKAVSTPKLMKRAKKKAKFIVMKKLMGPDIVKNYSKLPYQKRIQIDRKIAPKQAVINRIAKKMVPKLRKAHAERRRKMSSSDQDLRNK
jgi:hypothetical protein